MTRRRLYDMLFAGVFPGVSFKVVDKRRHNAVGADCIAADAFQMIFDGNLPCEVDHGALGQRVSRTGMAKQAADGADEYEDALLIREHILQPFPDKAHGTHGIGIKEVIT